MHRRILERRKTLEHGRDDLLQAAMLRACVS